MLVWHSNASRFTLDLHGGPLHLLIISQVIISKTKVVHMKAIKCGSVIHNCNRSVHVSHTCKFSSSFAWLSAGAHSLVPGWQVVFTIYSLQVREHV